MAALLQHQATTLIARIQTAGARGHCLAFKASWIASASSASNGGKAHHALRLKADYLVGAGHNDYVRTLNGKRRNELLTKACSSNSTEDLARQE